MRAFGFLVALAVAGCGGGEYHLRSAYGGGSGLPVVAMEPAGITVVPPSRGRTLGLAVRTFVPGADGWAEIAGARCRVTAGEFLVADLVTPARLTLPDLGPDAPPLRADCSTGTAQGTDVVMPAFGWPESGPQAAERVWWGGGWWYGGMKTGPLHYPDLAVGLRPTS
jgi:hypothetical protein